MIEGKEEVVGSLENGWSGRRKAEQEEDQPKICLVKVTGRKRWIEWVDPSDGGSYNVWQGPLSYHSFMHLFIYLSHVYM